MRAIASGFLICLFSNLVWAACDTHIAARTAPSSFPKSVAIIHHHLRAGGVTRVIENAIYALEKIGIKSVVVTGEAPHTSVFSHRNVIVVPEINYADTYQPGDVALWKEKIEKAVSDALGAPPDVWHFHNSTLGKNVGVTALVSRMAREGYPLVLQLHDFAEDGRPANYQKLSQQWKEELPLEKGLYPSGPNVRYSVLNGRDYQNLLTAGLDPQQIDFLPNPVWFQKTKLPHNFESFGGKRLFLYPTRAIRRKNLGEFLFWASVSDKRNHFATTLAPKEGNERKIYDEWVGFARRLGLPVTFEAGQQWRMEFDQLLSAADTFVTTSVAEGFGLAFLEPWLIGRPLAGRDLPAITSDFRNAGVTLPNLYTRLDIPIEIIGRDRLIGVIDAELGKYLSAYGRPYTPPVRARALEALIGDGTVDFGILSEPLQKEVILAVRTGNLPSGHPGYALCDETVPAEIIEANSNLLRESFGLGNYGERLLHIYNSVGQGDSRAYVSAAGVLAAFLNPNGFCLLRN